MSVELARCSEDRALFMRMAEDYVLTLQAYDNRIVWDEPTWSKAMWDSCFIVDDGVACGFIITQEIRYKKLKDLLYIAEIYVVPGERGRGVGIDAVRAAIQGWGGDVFLYVIKENAAGMAFWNAVEKKMGWHRTLRRDVREEAGCELRVYTR